MSQFKKVLNFLEATFSVFCTRGAGRRAKRAAAGVRGRNPRQLGGPGALSPSSEAGAFSKIEN